MRLGEMTRAEIDALLQSQTIAHLGCQRDGEPYVLPMNYAYAHGAVYLHCLEGTKIEILRKNPRTCVQVDHIEGPVSWQSVVAFGVFEELRGEAAQAALRILVARLMPPGTPASPDPFVPPALQSRVVMVRIPIVRVSGRFAQP